MFGIAFIRKNILPKLYFTRTVSFGNIFLLNRILCRKLILTKIRKRVFAISIIWKLIISTEKFSTKTIFSIGHVWSETDQVHRKVILSKKYFVGNVFQNTFPKEYFPVKCYSNEIRFQKNIIRRDNFQTKTIL